MNARRFLSLALAACLLLPACATRKAPAADPTESTASAAAKTAGTFAVAGFTQPRSSWELLAGYIPENAQPVDAKVLDDLDDRLAEALSGNKRLSPLPARLTRQCQEIATFKQKDSRTSALKYWLQVGECMGVDRLLVPQLILWSERDGSEMSVRTPAGVVLELFLVDVSGKSLARRFHYDETQLSLSENLLEARKFVQRGGKWITAGELAAEGLAQGVGELGLR